MLFIHRDHSYCECRTDGVWDCQIHQFTCNKLSVSDIWRNC